MLKLSFWPITISVIPCLFSSFPCFWVGEHLDMSVYQPSKSRRQIWHQHGFVLVVYFFLFIKSIYSAISYVIAHKVKSINVTLTDNNKEAGLVKRIFNIAWGTLTIIQTLPKPIWIALDSELRWMVPLCWLFSLWTSSKCTKLHTTLPRCVDTTQLAIIPVFSLPGIWEYFISPGTNKRIAVLKQASYIRLWQVAISCFAWLLRFFLWG